MTGDMRGTAALCFAILFVSVTASLTITGRSPAVSASIGAGVGGLFVTFAFTGGGE